MIKALKTLLPIGLAVFFILFFSAEARAAVNTPEIIKLTASEFLSLSGTAPANSQVLIYLDNSFIGQAGVGAAAGCYSLGTECQFDWSFQYQPSQKLADGEHLIIAVAQDKTSLVLSSPTEEKRFVIPAESVVEIIAPQTELPMPAPTMLEPVVNQATSFNRPFIVGLAKNNSTVKIYIDGKYDGELLVNNHESGTANFAYKPSLALARGQHSVYTVALDQRGKASSHSNVIDFLTKSAAIAQSAVEERQEAVAEIKEPSQPAEITSEPVVISEASGTVIDKAATAPADAELTEREKAIKQELKDKENAALEKVKGLIGAETEPTESDRGMINEGEENQGRLKLDLILFILLLLGVVVWLFWVNRELIKERRAQAESGEKNDEAFQPGRGRDNKLF